MWGPKALGKGPYNSLFQWEAGVGWILCASKGYSSVWSYSQVSITWVCWDETIRSGASNNCASYFWLTLTSPCTQPHLSHSISSLYKQKFTYGLNRKTEKDVFVFCVPCPCSSVVHISRIYGQLIAQEHYSTLYPHYSFSPGTLVLYLLSWIKTGMSELFPSFPW